MGLAVVVAALAGAGEEFELVGGELGAVAGEAVAGVFEVEDGSVDFGDGGGGGIGALRAAWRSRQRLKASSGTR